MFQTPTLERESHRGLSDSLTLAVARGIADPPSTEGPSHPALLSDLRIRTKDKRLLPLVPNAVQRLYLKAILPDWQETPTGLRGTRDIVLKARQEGFSTLILALYYLDTITHPNTQTVVIAHDAESTERLFQMVHRFQKYLPEEKRPQTKYSTRRELVWEALDSYFFVATAGAGDVGRGGTINNVHMSEVGAWRNGEEIVAGLLQSVPVDGNVFAESTAKGPGNWFHSEWVAAEKGDSVFTPRFFGWYELPEYRSEVEAGFTRTEDEEKIASVYPLDNAQLSWRRGKIKELRSLFPQEYPANPREAFLTSGNPYFDREYLGELSDALESAEYDPIQFTVPSGHGVLKRGVVNGGLTLWKLPEPDCSYIIAADTAEGLTAEGDHDYDSADVFDAETWEQVAHLHGRWDTHEYGLMLADLARWYNYALLGIERNNHGHAVLNAARYTGDYPESTDGRSGIYLHEEWDETKPTETKRMGWPTTVKTKYFALDTLATLLDERALRLRSRHSVSELMTFVKLPNGKAGGEGKCHDDAVTSLSIAAALLKLKPVGNPLGGLIAQGSTQGWNPRL